MDVLGLRRWIAVFPDVIWTGNCLAESDEWSRDCRYATYIITIPVEKVGLWRKLNGSGYFYLFFPSPSFRTKKERERNLKTVIDE